MNTIFKLIVQFFDWIAGRPTPKRWPGPKREDSKPANNDRYWSDRWNY